MTRNPFILAVQLLHTAAFVVVSAMVLYVLRCAITGLASRRLLIVAIAAPSLVGIAWVLNGGECIVSTLFYWLPDNDRPVPDISLPTSFAQWIMTGTTAVLLLPNGQPDRRARATCSPSCD